MNKVLVVVLLCLWGGVVMARPLEGVFPDAKTVENGVIHSYQYPLALGVLKKVNAEWIAERERLIKGTLYRHTVEFPSGTNEQEVLASIAAEAKQQSGHLVFACEGLDCGSSNAWANTRFEVKQLYGKDQSQAYRVWEFNSVEGHFIAVAYTVKRGNRRVYAHTDVIALASQENVVPLVASAKAIETSLEEQGYFVFRGLNAQGDEFVIESEYVEPVVKLMRGKPLLKLNIVGHHYSQPGQEANTALSKTYAEALLAELVNRGVKPNRLNALVGGDAVPKAKGSEARIILIKQ